MMEESCDCMFLLFFFKQKTAYEMRISDWSSDVCSSDLSGPATAAGAPHPDRLQRPCPRHLPRAPSQPGFPGRALPGPEIRGADRCAGGRCLARHLLRRPYGAVVVGAAAGGRAG